MKSTEKSVDAFEMATEAAKQAGAVYPEAVAEYLKDQLIVVDVVSGPRVVVRNGLNYESLDGVFARMKVTENVGSLFNGGKPDVRKMDIELFQAFRKHNPEVLGLRKKRRFS
jgi:hypothetical protein